MKLPKLYSRRSDGKLNEWEIEVEDNRYRVASGIKDGSLVCAEWTTCAGKNIGRANETSPDEQAYAEAVAKWTKKKAEKYSENPDNVDTEAMYQVMLAKNFEDYESKLFDSSGLAKVPLSVSPKLDGIRNIAKKDGMKSRNGKSFVACPHIEEALKPLFDKYLDLILDGELYTAQFKDDFNSIASCVKRSKPSAEDIEESKKIEYHIYDIPSSEFTFAERYSQLTGLVASIDNPYIKLVEAEKIYRREELTTFYSKYIEEGYEGAMVRITNSIYENKRSKSLLKVKSFKDTEAIVDKVLEGKGNRSNNVGCVTLLHLDGSIWVGEDGKQQKSGVKGSMELLKGYFNNPETIEGKIVTVKYFNVTPSGALRFPTVLAIRDYE